MHRKKNRSNTLKLRCNTKPHYLNSQVKAKRITNCQIVYIFRILFSALRFSIRFQLKKGENKRVLRHKSNQSFYHPISFQLRNSPKREKLKRFIYVKKKKKKKFSVWIFIAIASSHSFAFAHHSASFFFFSFSFFYRFCCLLQNRCCYLFSCFPFLFSDLILLKHYIVILLFFFILRFGLFIFLCSLFLFPVHLFANKRV